MTKHRRRDNQSCTRLHRECTPSRLRTWREGSTFLTGEAKNASHSTVSGMDPLEEQFDPQAKPAYFDLDMPDVSEQQFAASLEDVVRPAFVVDTTEAPPVERVDLPPPKLELQGPAARPSDVGPPVLDATPRTVGDDWRDQVSAKINHYKSRKPPKVRYPSLQLEFEPPPPRERRMAEFEPDLPAEPSAHLENPLARAVPGLISRESTARVIEFPRIAPPPARLDELAEPVLDKPRIVEAPALVLPPPALGGILIEETQEQEPDRRPGFDMPLQSAPLSRRILAGFLDLLLVATALALFRYVFVRLNGPMPQTKLVIQLAGALLAIFWPAYQYSFLVFTGTTPGLRLTGLAVTHFDGRPVSRSQRRWRVLASFLSCASLGLGYAWCFLDEDQLSWHDRITKTHLAPMNSSAHSLSPVC
jgi:uncharacterized RDD family membrane protein YckC